MIHYDRNQNKRLLRRTFDIRRLCYESHHDNLVLSLVVSLHPGYVISSTEWMCLGSKDKRTAVLSLTAQFRQK